MAVERHPRFEPKRVAAREPRGHESGAEPGLEDVAPERRGGVRRKVQLESVLAGVASAGDEQFVLAPRTEGARPGAVVLEACKVVNFDAGHLAENLERTRTLQRDQRDVVRFVEHVAVEVGCPFDEFPGHPLTVRRVGDDEEAVIAGAVHDQIVDDATRGGEQQGVLCLADRRG